MVKKHCSKCGQVKPAESFARKRRRKKYSYCLECRDEANALYHEKLKQRRLEVRYFIYTHLLKHPCACGESAPEALEFDHRRDKVFDISHAARMGIAIPTVKQEIEKCVVMCSNCHRKRTALEQHWYADIKTLMENSNK